MRTGIPSIERRALLLGAGASLFAGQVHGQTPPPEIADPPEIDDIRLTRNLFTRLATFVSINGQGPFSFVVDTGSARTAISDTVAQQLALPPREPLLVHGIATATVTPSVGVARLNLQGVAVRNLHCPVLQRDQLGADGLIGLDVLSRFRLGFDTERRTASLSSNRMRIVSGGVGSTGSRLNRDGLRTARGRLGQLIITDLRISGQPAAAFVDSGAQYSIGNHALMAAIQARRADGLSASRGVPVFGVTGHSIQAVLARVADLRLGAYRLGATTLLFSDLHCFEALGLSQRPALLIGADLLGRFKRIALDFAENTVAFEGLRPPSIHALDDPVSV
ncbi:aspartyl protease family protein [Brevundimonas sp.]